MRSCFPCWSILPEVVERSHWSGGSDSFLDKYEFKNLYDDYYQQVSNPQQAVGMRNKNIKTIIKNFDK